MTRSSLYSGPGKIYMGGVALQAEGEAGKITLGIKQATDPYATGMHGRIGDTRAGTLLDLGITPFDNWGALALLYPAAYRTPTIGARFPAATNPPSDPDAKVWTPDGRLYTLKSAFVEKPPELHLGVGKALFGSAQITGVIGENMDIGDAGAFYTLATNQADPGGPMTLDDFVRGQWTGAWGEVAGFALVEAEEEWVVSCELKWKALSVQKCVRAYQLDSVRYMARCRPVGPTQPQLDDALAIQKDGVLGERFTGPKLQLTGPSGKTIALPNASLVSAGFEFGGNQLGNGEIGFITGMTFDAGAIQPLIQFS